MKRIRRFIFPVILILAVVAALWYYWVRPAGSLATAWNSLINPARGKFHRPDRFRHRGNDRDQCCP